MSSQVSMPTRAAGGTMRVARQGFALTTLLSLVGLFVLSVLGLGVQQLQPNSAVSGDLMYWFLRNGVGLGASALMAALFALLAPTLLLSAYGEWFYTRSLERRSLITAFLSEFCLWWGLLSAGLLALTACSQLFGNYDSGSGLAWSMAYLAMFSSLFGTFLLTLSAQGLRQMALPLGLALAWLVWGSGLKFDNLPVGVWVSYLVGALLLLRMLQLHHQSAGDLTGLDPERPLAPILEQPHWLDLPEQRGRRVQLRHAPLGRWRLLTVHGHLLGMLQLFGGTLVLGAWLAWLLPRAGYDSGFGGFSLMGLLAAMLSALLLAAAFSFLSPRLMVSGYQEFLRSRAVRPLWLYLANWGVQGVLIGVLVGFAAIISLFHPLLVINLKLPMLWSLGLLLWLGGSVVMTVGVVLVAISAAFAPALVVAALSLFYTPDWPAWALWGLLMALRLWDLWTFTRSEELQGGRPSGKSLLQKSLPFALSLGLVLWTVQSQPLTRWLARSSAQSYDPLVRWETGAAMLQILFSRSRLDLPSYFGYRDAALTAVVDRTSLEKLMADPHNPEVALDMAQKLFQTYRSEQGMREYTTDMLMFDSERGYLLDTARYWMQVGAGAPPARQRRLDLQMLALRGQYLQGLQLADQLYRESGEPDLLMERARFEAQLFRHEAALASYRQLARELKTPQPQFWTEAAQVAAEAGQSEVALGYLLRALQQFAPGLRESAEVEFRLLILNRGLDCTQIQAISRDPRWKPFLQTRTTQLFNELEACAGRPEQIVNNPLLQGRTYLALGQPERALDVLRRSESSSVSLYQAEALFALGQKQAALPLLEKTAQTWAPSTFAFVRSWRVWPERSVIGVHRLLLQTRPQANSGWTVLFGSRQLDQDWPLIEQAYRDQPATLAQLRQTRQDIETVYAAFAAHGARNLPGTRSRDQIILLTQLVDQLPARDAALNAAVARIRKSLEVPA